MSDGGSRTVALIGDPVAHSVSPAMHRAAFAVARLDGWDYVAVRVQRGALAAAFPALRGRFAGLNVTIPLKDEVIPLLDRVDEPAAWAGSVNTAVFAAGSATGFSTDGEGFMAALERTAMTVPARALVIGTGGAGRAVASALLSRGAEVVLAGRDPRRAAASAARLGRGAAAVSLDPDGGVPGRCDLVVNATPLGGPGFEDRSPLPPGWKLPPGVVVFDLVYRPRRTVLLGQAERAGCRTVEGIEMLIEQGARSFSLWTRAEAPVEAMRAAAYAAVDVPAGVGR